MSNSRYGLILPENEKSKKLIFQATRNVFGDDSDSENESKKKPVLLPPNQNTVRQAKIMQEKAVKEDPTVYQYDEVYDSMVNKKKEETNKVKEIKKPKYIENLLKTASKRKIENERRIERQVQKEREKEGEEFADKEVFVTSAYKKKLEEMRLEEEKEKREEYLEKIGDVTKQKDLGGFYRHLYEQKLGSTKEEKKEDSSNEKLDDLKKTDEIKQKQQNDTSAKKLDSNKKINRNYRKRKSSECNSNLSDGEIVETDDEINHVNIEDIRANKRLKKDQEENIDADSDFSVDDPSEDEVDDNKSIKEKDKVKEVAASDDTKDNTVKQPKIEQKPEVKSVEEPKVVEKIDIWKKRTVGEVFDQALKRYYERKASRA